VVRFVEETRTSIQAYIINHPTLIFPGTKHAYWLNSQFFGINVSQIKRAEIMPEKTKVG